MEAAAAGQKATGEKKRATATGEPLRRCTVPKPAAEERKRGAAGRFFRANAKRTARTRSCTVSANFSKRVKTNPGKGEAV
ncbi:hypothetical protein ZHAS_00017680 [Anopheles sinensis]|uniref:Uncharacterized protein n=1 Tax=Anopheles sinensis TaxID=74873 RepID=A0A084WGY6_ANOSI|nr:hypothetical protein ZHAS_00017680 [Anopheles sinensis]